MKTDDRLNETLLAALKALLYLADMPGKASNGTASSVTDLARTVIDLAEGRLPQRGLKINGIPDGWYDDILTGKAEHPFDQVRPAAAVAAQIAAERMALEEAAACETGPGHMRP